MKYEFAKLDGNKVVGLAIHLAPKQGLRDYITVTSEDWNDYVADIRAKMTKASESIDKPILIDVEINHRGQGLQQIAFDDLKEILFGAAQ